MAALTALLALGSVALIALVPGLVDSGFIGWLDMPIAARLVLHVPLALAVVGAGTVMVTAAGRVGHWWPVRLQYAALAVAVIAVAAQLGACTSSAGASDKLRDCRYAAAGTLPSARALIPSSIPTSM